MFYLLLLLLTQFDGFLSTPGIKTIIYPSGARYMARNFIIKTLQTSFTGTILRDYSKNSQRVFKAKSRYMRFPERQVTSGTSGNSITMEAQSGEAKLIIGYQTGSWTFFAEVLLENLNMNIFFTLGTTPSPLTPRVESCKVNADLTIAVRSGAALSRKIEQNLKNDVLDFMSQEICSLVLVSIKMLTPKLMTAKVYNFNDVFVDYSLQNVRYDNNRIILDHTGQFFSLQTPTPIPGHADPLNETILKDGKMIHILISSYTMNSAGFVYHAGGYLDMNITKAGLREIVPYIELDTEFLGIVFPEMSKRYPNKEVKLTIKSTSPPQTIIKNGGLEFKIPLMLSVIVLNEKNEEIGQPIRVEAYLDGSAGISGSQKNVEVHVDDFEFDVINVHSEIGEIDDNVFKVMADSLKRSVLIPFLNAKGAQGVPLLPIDFIKLTDVTVTLDGTTCIVSADLELA